VQYDFWGRREGVVPLPGKDEGYTRVQLIGTTGAGKTTLVRELLGTHPKEERFPSTSTARTTTAEMEIVLREGSYQAVVTFLPQDRVRLYIEECVLAAAQASLEGKSFLEMSRKLLQHNDNRFRLSYILGTYSKDSDDDLDDDSDDDSESDESDDDAALRADRERPQLIERLNSYLRSIADLVSAERTRLEDMLGPFDSAEDKEAFQELLEEQLLMGDDFEAIVQVILDDVKDRSNFLPEGTGEFGRSGWPEYWSWEIGDRETFVRTINLFSSNRARLFGQLLTPLVQGIRVAGPFRSTWAAGGVPQLVLLDGEGLGHTSESATALPTTVMRRHDLADSILLVDNAVQPMQAAPLAVVRSIISGGHLSKLVIAFTHFENVKGANLPDLQSRKDHVRGSLDNIVAAITRDFGASTGRVLDRIATEGAFFLGSIHQALNEKRRATIQEMRRLLEVLASEDEPEPTGNASPTYDLRQADGYVELAVRDFRELWAARFGTAFRADTSKEHWTRIKALSRRFALQWDDEYDDLRPVAELAAGLRGTLRIYLSRPLGRDVTSGATEAEEAAIDLISQELSRRLITFATSRLFEDHTADWMTAFERRGRGSATWRANDISSIYDVEVPRIQARYIDTPIVR
jgi:energy-coupling factor transporter ATP-binding protein EcfA2